MRLLSSRPLCRSVGRSLRIVQVLVQFGEGFVELGRRELEMAFGEQAVQLASRVGILGQGLAQDGNALRMAAAVVQGPAELEQSVRLAAGREAVNLGFLQVARRDQEQDSPLGGVLVLVRLAERRRSPARRARRHVLRTWLRAVPAARSASPRASRSSPASSRARALGEQELPAGSGMAAKE